MAFYDLVWSNKAPVGPARSAHPCIILLLVMVGASVFALPALGCPTNIAGGVIAIVVDPVNGVTGRALANINEEVFKFMPAFTDLDTASTIVFVTDGVRVLASCAHAVPGAIKRMEVSGSGVAVDKVAFQAAAGFSFPFYEKGGCYDFGVSAITLTLPEYVAEGVSIGGRLKSNQFAEALTFGDDAPAASTRERGTVITSKAAFKDVAFLTTIAVAEPSALSGWLDRSQSSEPHACDIDGLAHRTASDGLREVTGSMLEALVPLRIIAQQ